MFAFQMDRINGSENLPQSQPLIKNHYPTPLSSINKPLQKESFSRNLLEYSLLFDEWELE